MLKKISVVICLMFVCIFCFGCAKADFSTKYYKDGSIVTTLLVTLDEEYANSYNASVVLRKTACVASVFITEMQTRWNLKITTLLEESEDPVTHLANVDLHNFLNQMKIQTPTADIKIENENRTLKIIKMYPTYTYAGYYAYLLFNHPYMFTYDAEKNDLIIDNRYLSDIPLENDIQILEGDFITEYIQKISPFLFDGRQQVFDNTWRWVDGNKNTLSKTGAGEVAIEAGDTLVQALNRVNGGSYGLNNVDATYSFLTPYKRVKSDGERSSADGYYVHTWDINSFDDTITLSRRYAETALWYVVIYSAVAGVMTMALLAIYLKRKTLQLFAAKRVRANVENKLKKQEMWSSKVKSTSAQVFRSEKVKPVKVKKTKRSKDLLIPIDKKLTTQRSNLVDSVYVITDEERTKLNAQKRVVIKASSATEEQISSKNPNLVDDIYQGKTTSKAKYKTCVCKACNNRYSITANFCPKCGAKNSNKREE